MKVVLCSHHKGGVGKTELAIHVAGIFRQGHAAKTLLIDCDSHADAFKFHFGGELPKDEGDLRPVSDNFSILWQPSKKSVGTRDRLARSYDYIVIDIDAAMEDTVQTLVQSHPDLVLIPVDNQHDALTNLDGILGTLARLEKTIGLGKMAVRIVPNGVDSPRANAIRDHIATLKKLPKNCAICPKIPELENKANKARRNGKYLWHYSGCEGLQDYYRNLIL